MVEPRRGCRLDFAYLLLAVIAFVGWRNRLQAPSSSNHLAALHGSSPSIAYAVTESGRRTTQGTKEREEQADDSSAESVLREHVAAIYSPRLHSWMSTATGGRKVHNFGVQATRMIDRATNKFDELATELSQEAAVNNRLLKEERELMLLDLQKKLHAIFLVQRSNIEETLYLRLKQSLLKRMRRKGRELQVKEKLRLLSGALKEYDTQVQELQPEFVADSERDRAERRLSELQYGILNSPEGKELRQRWKMDKLRRMQPSRQRRLTVSLSPGMRMMFRPDGLGNFQMNGRRPVGPPHNPNEISVAALNDGNVVDVYNKKPKPSLIKFQPTIGIDFSTG